MKNPYAEYLGGRDPITVMTQTPEELRRLATVLASRLDQAPVPGKWSPREILCHLADTEIAYAFRLRQAVAETHHVIQPFDQARWAASYAAYDTNSALVTFAALRAWDVAFITPLSSDTKKTRLWHPERGEMSLQVMIEMMAGHDLNHVRQLEAMTGLMI